MEKPLRRFNQALASILAAIFAELFPVFFIALLATQGIGIIIAFLHDDGLDKPFGNGILLAVKRFKRTNNLLFNWGMWRFSLKSRYFFSCWHNNKGNFNRQR